MKFLFSGILVALAFIVSSCEESEDKEKPVEAFFSSTTSNPSQNESIRFTSLNNTNVISWEWTFEGGTPATSTEESPVVTYAERGVFGVKLVVRSEDSVDSVEVPDHVNVGQVVYTDFEADQTTIDAGGVITYTTSPNTNVEIWEWTFEGGTPATLNATTGDPVAVTYDTAGTYKTTLVAKGAASIDEDGNEFRETIIIERENYITINPILFVDATFQADTPTSIDEAETVTYSIVDDTNVDTYLWTFQGGTPPTSSDANPTVTYNTPGQHDVTLTVSSSNDSDTATETDFVDVTDIFFVDATFSANVTSVVVGNTVTFTVTDATDITGYNWSFPGGTPANSTAASPTVTYNTVGMYNVSLTVNSSNDSDTVTNTNYINVTATSGPTTLLDESFETDGNGTRYTASEVCNDGFDFFTRTDGTDVGNGTVYVVNNPDGNFYFAAMDTDGAPCTSGTQTLLFDDVNIAGYTGLELSIMVAEDDDGTNEDWDDDTYMFVEVDINNSGAFTKVLQFAASVLRPDGSTSTSNKEPGVDDDFDGFADGTILLSDVFQNFTKNIAGTGNTMDIRITFQNLNAGDEDIAIDKIVLTGM